MRKLSIVHVAVESNSRFNLDKGPRIISLVLEVHIGLVSSVHQIQILYESYFTAKKFGF